MGLPCCSSKEDTHSSILSTSFSPKMAKQSQIRQNYHEECEALVNKQVNMELYYSYVYLSIPHTSPVTILLCLASLTFSRRLPQRRRIMGRPCRSTRPCGGAGWCCR